MTNETLMDKLAEEIASIENKLKYPSIYNLRNLILQAFVKSGIALDYSLPFLLSTTIASSIFASCGNVPFRVDNIKQKASIETLDTSARLHLERASFDYQYNQEFIEHSTGWTINQYGLYERTVTSYNPDSELNLSDPEKVFSRSLEELQNLLVITNIETISKKNLTPEDEIYNEDAFIIQNHHLSKTITITRPETFDENFLTTVLCLGPGILLGLFFKELESSFIKIHLRDILKSSEPNFKFLSHEELEILKKVLVIKKQNYDLLNTSTTTASNDTPLCYTLRKEYGDNHD